MRRTKGSFASLDVRENMDQSTSGALGDVNLQDKALGVGTPQDGKKVGKHNAVWADVTIKAGADLTNFEVPHSLGQIPVVCSLVEWSNSAVTGLFFVAAPINKDKWTKTTCRVAVREVVGVSPTTGTILRFRVEGA